jgi:hypothetical protein
LASEDGILEVLQDIADGLDKEPPVNQIEMFLRVLEDYEFEALKFAALECVKNSAFFPAPSEVIRFAKLYKPPERDELAARQIELEDEFYRSGEIDEKAWEKLAVEFRRRGRPHREEFTREKLRRILVCAQT